MPRAPTVPGAFKLAMPPETFAQRTLRYAAILALPLALGVLLGHGAIALVT